MYIKLGFDILTNNKTQAIRVFMAIMRYICMYPIRLFNQDLWRNKHIVFIMHKHGCMYIICIVHNTDTHIVIEN